MRIYAISNAPEFSESIQTQLLRTTKPHSTPVVTSAVDSTGSLLATGGADGVVKVWDIRGGYVTHTFHGHSGVISALHFFQVSPATAEESSNQKQKKVPKRAVEHETGAEDTANFRLASGDEDGKVKIWNLHKRKSVASLETHVSVVRSLDFSQEHGLLLSASRDKTAILWDAQRWEPASTIPVLESVETSGFLQHGKFFFTGGEKARLKIWSTLSGKEITEDQVAGTETESILEALSYPDLSFILTVHADQQLVLHSTSPLEAFLDRSTSCPPLPMIRRISGTHDEIIDLAFVGSRRDLLALATNLEDLRLISVESPEASSKDRKRTLRHFGEDVALLKGHSDIIITIDTDWSGHWLATGAKDNTAKLWRLDPDNDSYTCYATVTGHAESIGAVALPNAVPAIDSTEYEKPLTNPPKYMITGSQDKTVKRWDIGAHAGKSVRAAYTRKAHDKDINAITTSYSAMSPLFASASQDRTVKIWDVQSGETIGVLKGHKRGVWTVAFSPPGMPALNTTGEGHGASSARGMVVTGSADKTIKIWSLSDYSCLRTFEGHANSVLKVVWLPPSSAKTKEKRGVQVASAAGDGLVKVWDAQDGECAATLDNHIDRVWALTVKPSPLIPIDQSTDADDVDSEDEENGTNQMVLEIVSGSADSTLTFWKDTTSSTALQATTQATARIEQDQQLENYIRASSYREAIVLALQLNHPRRLLEIFTRVTAEKHDQESFTGSREVDHALSGLSDGQIMSLLRRIRDWNTNSRTYHVAQCVLYALLRLFPKDRLLKLQTRRKALVNSTNDDEELAAGMNRLDTKSRLRNNESTKDVINGLKVYTERHYARLDKTAEERFVLLWALQQMSNVGSQPNGLLSGSTDSQANGDVLMLEAL